MTGEGNHMYTDLAAWWPLVSPVEDYAEEAAYAERLLRSACAEVRDVLELGSGGGHNAHHLLRSFTMTLVDISPGMLRVSEALNPGCHHVEGDLRSLRVGRTYDAVLVHDAVDYMTTEDDLRAAVETAFVHCRSGGGAVFIPDHVRETFVASTDHGGTDGADGRGVRYLEWTWDPDPDDTEVVTEYAFVLRSPAGSVDVVHDTHRTGLFSTERWLDVLRDAGFEPEAVTEETTEDRTPRTCFVARRPAGGPPAAC